MAAFTATRAVYKHSISGESMAEQPQQPALDPTALSKAYADIVQRSSHLMADYMKRQSTSAPSVFGDELGIAKAFFDMTANMLANPAQIAEMQMKLWQDYMTLWQNSMMQMFGQPTRPVIEPEKTDRRFKHADWQQNFLFDYI